MEVVAKKQRWIFWVYLAIFLLGVAALIAIVVGREVLSRYGNSMPPIIFILLLLMALVLIAIGVKFGLEVLKTPDAIILFENDRLKFADGFECFPQELTQIRYRQMVRYGIASLHLLGELKIATEAEVHKYRFIADVASVHDRLLALKDEAKEKNNG